MEDRIKDMIQNADLILIGIGEEFDQEHSLKQIPGYRQIRERLEATGQDWLIPFLNRFFADKMGEEICQIKDALSNLVEMVKGKNYFLVSVATNDYVWEAGFKEDRIVAPCGGSLKKQCMVGGSCAEMPVLLSEEEQAAITDYFHKLSSQDDIADSDIADSGAGLNTNMQESFHLGVCPQCGSPMILNNIYTEKYDERGYLEQWQKYTKWLQGTLNKKLCILELGVGMQCPSVIRFPFEKVGYFNQKADFIRVNRNLYQLTEELKEKGISISENAVDWLASCMVNC